MKKCFRNLMRNRIPIRLKVKFCRIAIKPVTLYGSECWPMKKQHVDRMDVAKMMMLKWMGGKTRKDSKRDGSIRDNPRVVPI